MGDHPSRKTLRVFSSLHDKIAQIGATMMNIKITRMFNHDSDKCALKKSDPKQESTANVVRSPKLRLMAHRFYDLPREAAIGVATLSGLMLNFLAVIITEIMTILNTNDANEALKILDVDDLFTL